MVTKGHCKHGEFILIEGCHQCIADRMGKEGNTEASIAEAVKSANRTSERLPSGLAEAAQAAGAEVTVVDMGPPTETALALRHGEDIEAHGYFHESLKLLEYAKGRVIATVEDSKSGTDDLSIISKLKKAMDGKRKFLLDPLKADMDAIRDTYNYLMAPVLEADKITRAKMVAFDAEQKRIRAEQEEVNRLRMEAAQKEMKLKGELSESVNLVEVTPVAPTTIRTDTGTVGQRDNWKWEVTDFSIIPDEYKIINAGMVTPVVKASKGKITISGIRIFNEPIIAVNAR